MKEEKRKNGVSHNLDKEFTKSLTKDELYELKKCIKKIRDNIGE